MGLRPQAGPVGDSKKYQVQRTLKSSVTFQGVGLHSGRLAHLTVRPASADYGIWFRRSDILTGDALIPARWDAVQPSSLCTLLTNGKGATVSTVEHLMAALAGLGIHNALIDIDGPEVPILDGSAVAFVDRLLARGLIEQATPVRAIRVLKPVEVAEGPAWARLEPAEVLEIDFAIDFADAGDRPAGAGAEHGQRQLRARIVRQPDLLPAGGCRCDARPRPGAGRVAGKCRGFRRRPGSEPGRAAPPRRAGAPQDAGCAGRPGAGRGAAPGPLYRRARGPCD